MSNVFEELERENHELSQLLCKVAVIGVGQTLKHGDVRRHQLLSSIFARVTLFFLSLICRSAAAKLMMTRFTLLFLRNWVNREPYWSKWPNTFENRKNLNWWACLNLVNNCPKKHDIMTLITWLIGLDFDCCWRVYQRRSCRYTWWAFEKARSRSTLSSDIWSRGTDYSTNFERTWENATACTQATLRCANTSIRAIRFFRTLWWAVNSLCCSQKLWIRAC